MIAAVPPATDEDVAAVSLGPLSLEELEAIAALDDAERGRLEEWLRDDLELAINTAAARRSREAEADPRNDTPA